MHQIGTDGVVQPHSAFLFLQYSSLQKKFPKAHILGDDNHIDIVFLERSGFFHEKPSMNFQMVLEKLKNKPRCGGVLRGDFKRQLRRPKGQGSG